MTKSAVLLAALMLISAGCSATTSLPTTKVTPATTNFKGQIEGLAKTGQIGSGAMELNDKFEQLKKEDSAKADAIKPDFDKLLKADGKPEQVKQLAAELAKKL